VFDVLEQWFNVVEVALGPRDVPTVQFSAGEIQQCVALGLHDRCVLTRPRGFQRTAIPRAGRIEVTQLLKHGTERVHELGQVAAFAGFDRGIESEL
jgi:hypothetical protein